MVYTKALDVSLLRFKTVSLPNVLLHTIPYLNFLKNEISVFFAVDNIDFAEDTADGKRTTHGTITVVYQKDYATGEVITLNLELSDAKSLTVTPYNVPIKSCSKPKPRVVKRTQKFKMNTNGIAKSYELVTLG